MKLVTNNKRTENGNTATIQKAENYDTNLASTLTTKLNIHNKKLTLYILWDNLRAIYYELFEPNET